MIEKSGTSVLVGVMNLLAVTSPIGISQSPHAVTNDQKIEKLNHASLKSIEGAWLKVPNSCKARAFNASATSVENKAPSASIQNIYASFEI